MNLTKIRKDLDRLEKLADKAVEEAIKQKEIFTADPINFADLNCTECYYCLDKNGIGHYQIVIEEADHRAVGLQAFVRDFLTDHGFSNVTVLTEW